MAGRLLIEQGQRVVVHSRNRKRADAARTALPLVQEIVIGAQSSLAAMLDLANQTRTLGRLDAVIHNVGRGYLEPSRVETQDGLSQLQAFRVLAACVLTASMARPEPLI